MRFSTVFNIDQPEKYDWFDPDLSLDTKLFVDPLMMLRSGPRWEHAHQILLDHFTECYRLIAKAPFENSLSAVRALELLTFPEPREFCLGYSAGSTKGSGTGPNRAKNIADGIRVALRAGLKVPEHIEEIGILNMGFGADSISDIALNILKSEFITYTQEIAAQLNIPTTSHQVRHTGVDLKYGRWLDSLVDLPAHPDDGSPIILVPKSILRDLPCLNPEEWFNSEVNSVLRAQMNLRFGEHASKAEIVREARLNPQAVREWTRAQTRRPDLRGYNFDTDILGVVTYDQAEHYAEQHPLKIDRPLVSQEDLSFFTQRMLENFKHFVEEEGGWRLLWDESNEKDKREEAAQLLFMGMSRAYLRQAGIELDREVELGRGPVDFKLTSGSKARLLVEVKKIHNGKFWNGLHNQLPSYLTSDMTREGWFIALLYKDTKMNLDRKRTLEQEVKATASKVGKDLRLMVIDVRPRMSASKI